MVQLITSLSEDFMAKAKVTKKQLLDIAYAIAIQEGLGALSVRRISASAGVAVGTFYNYFPSIDDLIYHTTIVFFEKNVRDKICSPTPDESFLSFCERVYPILNEALTTFNQNWIAQINAHSTLTQAQSFLTNSGIIKHGIQQLNLLLQRDIKAGRVSIPDTVATENIARYTLQTMLSSIKNGEDPNILFWLLRSSMEV